MMQRLPNGPMDTPWMVAQNSSSTTTVEGKIEPSGNHYVAMKWPQGPVDYPPT